MTGDPLQAGLPAAEPPTPEATTALSESLIESEDARWAGEFMRQNARRSWLAPLLAVPIAQIATETELPPSFLPLSEEELGEARDMGTMVLRATERLVGSPEAELTDEEALAVFGLSLDHRGLLNQIFGFGNPVEKLLGLPSGLAGEGLVRRLAECVNQRPEPPGRLALLVASRLDDQISLERDYLPVPHQSFVPLARAFDRRCYALGLRRWADALRHSASVWTPEAWRGVLMGYSAGALQGLIMSLMRLEAEYTAAPTVAKAAAGEPRRPRRPERQDPEVARLREALEEAKQEVETARAEAAATRYREEELIQARSRAQARLAEVSARNQELEDELQRTGGELRAVLATLRRLQDLSSLEEPQSAPVTPPPLPDDLLLGKTVFLFTGQERTAAARQQAEALRPLGAEDVRLYDVRQGRPGPDVFPSGSIVVVDTRFVGHAHTDEIEVRIRRSPPDVVYVPLRAGEGGLAARLAERLGW